MGRRKYFVHCAESKGKVCQKFFADVFEINSNYLDNARKNSRPSKGRIKDSPKHDALHHWLQGQEKFHEYMPDTVGAGRDPTADPAAAGGPSIARRQGVQLPYPNKKELYDEYARDMLARLAAPVPIGEQPPLPPCTINYFRQVWRTEFKNLHLRKHLRFSRCDVCVELRERFGRIENHCPIKHKATQAEFRAHINHVKAERTYYHKKREEAAKANSDTLSIIFDGADQGSYGEWLAAAAQLQRSQRILRDRIIAHLLALHVCVQASRTSTSDRSARRAWRRRSII